MLLNERCLLRGQAVPVARYQIAMMAALRRPFPAVIWQT